MPEAFWIRGQTGKIVVPSWVYPAVVLVAGAVLVFSYFRGATRLEGPVACAQLLIPETVDPSWILDEEEAAGEEDLFLSIRLLGSQANPRATGAAISICHDSPQQVVYRGVVVDDDRRSVSYVFSARNDDPVRVRVDWPDPDPSRTQRADVPVGSDLYIRHPENNPAYGMDLLPAIERVLRYFRSVHMEVASMLMMDNYARAFGLSGFEPLGRIYAALVARSDPRVADRLEAYWRILDRSQTTTREVLNRLTGVDAITMYALHCDVLGLPEDTAEVWMRALEAGGYDATHALMAYRWAVDNGCDVPGLPDDFLSLAVATTHALIDVRDGLDDLEVEAMCFLTLMDREDLIEREWVERLLSQQLEDGGWPATPDSRVAFQHTSALAACVLLSLHYYNEYFGPWPPR